MLFSKWQQKMKKYFSKTIPKAYVQLYFVGRRKIFVGTKIFYLGKMGHPLVPLYTALNFFIYDKDVHFITKPPINQIFYLKISCKSKSLISLFTSHFLYIFSQTFSNIDTFSKIWVAFISYQLMMESTSI